MSNKIFKAINSYKTIEDLDIGWYDRIERNLSNDTVKAVEESGIFLRPLAIIIKMTMTEIKDDEEIDRVFNTKFQDERLQIELMSKYKF